MSSGKLPAYLQGMSKAALANIEETGTDVRADLGALVSGETDAAALLASCLRGADADRVEGWQDYVSTLEGLADVIRSVAPDVDGAELEEPLVGAACWICSGTSYVMVGPGARCLGCKSIHYGWKLDGGAS